MTPLAEPRPVARRAVRPGLALVALVLLGLGLRGPVSSVGPLLDELRDAQGLSAAGVALLPTLPVLCFGLLAPAAPALAHRLGLHRAVLGGAAVLILGVAVRSAGVTGLFVGTALVGSGIAIANVLLPAVIKADFADRLPLATALLTSSVAVSASAGAGAAQPLRVAAGGPTASLAVWLVPVSVGLLAWGLLACRRGPAPDPGPAVARRLLPLLRDRVALTVTLFFGLQSLTFYTMLAWLPSVLRDAGVPAAQAGVMLAVASFLGAPVAFLVPRSAARRASQRRWVVLVATPSAAGLLGLLIAPAAAPWLWAVLLGLGTGAAFPLALTIIVMRSGDAAQAARLSAVAQGAGYVLAAAGPVGVGLLRGAVGSWGPCLVLLLGLLAAQVAVGLQAARARTVTG